VPNDYTSPHGPLCRCAELSLLNLDFSAYGTRFKLFPQSPLMSDYQTPEIVWISLSPTEILPGPSDRRMYVVDAIDKSHYEHPFLPPYRGDHHAPARPDADGHFDHLEVGSHQFEAAHMYGTLRWVLDIWETYFDRQIEWSFADHYERLELVPWLDWDNAHSGYGFIEMGYGRDDSGQNFPYNLNFDVLAHEFGHTLLYSVIGMPDDDKATAEFFAFHETASDLVAIVSLLHFNTVLDRLLSDTSGNLYTRNELNRIGEESDTRQIRMASNDKKMQHVPDPDTPLKDLSNKQIHDMSLPLTGALFDLLIEVFQHNLVDDGLIDQELDTLSRGLTEGDANEALVQALFDKFYRQNPEGFKKALVDARDYLGQVLSLSWEFLSWDLDFSQVVHALFQADIDLFSGHYQREIAEVFDWREIVY
jgi:hypothetical protein